MATVLGGPAVLLLTTMVSNCLGCIEYEPFTDSDVIFGDSDGATCLPRKSQVEIYVELEKLTTLFVDPKCVENSTVIEFEIAVKGNHTCSDQVLLNVPRSEASCLKLQNCRGKNLPTQRPDTTFCSVTCAKEMNNSNYRFQVELIQGLRNIDWQLCGIWVRQGCLSCNALIDFDRTLPQDIGGNTLFEYVDGFIDGGVKLNSSTGDQVQIDSAGIKPCVLTAEPDDGANGGATYMFWIKLLDSVNGAILTTMDWSPPREGIRMTTHNGKLKLTIFREGSTGNRFHCNVPDINDYVNDWLHITVVWNTPNPRFEVYYNGMPKTFNQGTQYASSSATQAATIPLKMFLGRDYVRLNTATPPKNMIFDELVVYDKPLTHGEAQQIIQVYN